MIRGPKPGFVPVDFAAKARECWGLCQPDWIAALALEACRIGAGETAKKLGYAPSVVSQVISNTYRGDLRRVEDVVRGALMAETVLCPVLDEIGRDRCRQEQSAPFRATNSTRAHLRRACRVCPNREVK